MNMTHALKMDSFHQKVIPGWTLGRSASSEYRLYLFRRLYCDVEKSIDLLPSVRALVQASSS